jgi:hypothetical protein
MRDFTSILFALGVLVVGAVVLIAMGRLFRKQPAKSDDRVKRESESRVREMVQSGRYFKGDDGRVVPKCRFCAEDVEATKRPYRWVRDDGVVDLVRRFFGAPAKVRVGRDPWAEYEACDVHDPMVFEEFRTEVAECEVDHAKLESEWETRRARFQRAGLYERVAAKIEKHQREIGGRRRKSEAPSKVVPFASARSTGTESK